MALNKSSPELTRLCSGPLANSLSASTTCDGQNRLQLRTTTGKYANIDFSSSLSSILSLSLSRTLSIRDLDLNSPEGDFA